MTDDDVAELTKVIGNSGKSAKMWCVFLKMPEDTCNRVDKKHLDDQSFEVAHAYLKEKENPCWEEIVNLLCNVFNLRKHDIKDLSKKHGVDFDRICKKKSEKVN